MYLNRNVVIDNLKMVILSTEDIAVVWTRLYKDDGEYDDRLGD